MTSVNDVIFHKWTWYEKYFFSNYVSDPNKQKCHKNNVNGLKMAKECQKVAFFCISYVKHTYKGHIAKTCLTNPSTSLHMSKPKFL